MPDQRVVLYSGVTFVQSLLFIISSQKWIGTGFSGATLFYFSSAIFCSVMPALSVITDYHFLIHSNDITSIEKLVALVFALNISFFIGHRVHGRPCNQPEWVLPPINYQRIKIIAYIALAIGLISMMPLASTMMLPFLGGNYVEIGMSLRGSGWIIRLSEFVAVAGLLLFFLGKEQSKTHLVVLGIACIVFFALFRMPFQNRENAIKYFVILLIAIHLYRPVVWGAIKTIIYYCSFAAVLFALPLTTALRAGLMSSDFISEYKYFLFRDLNFSEVASSLLAKADSNSSIGLPEGITSIFSILIPRQLWDDKPYPISVTFTSWVTPVQGYDIANPSFAYAPMYIGFGYVIGGYMMVVGLAFFSGWSIGALDRFGRRATGASRALDISLASILIYSLSLTFHKLEPGLILAAVFLPIFYLSIARKMIRMNISTS